MACLLLGLASAAAPTEQPIEVQGPSGRLAGTMAVPAQGEAPVVLIIPGSGPTDRDGNNPMGVRAATYRLLAEGLAERGVASVRIDKRGMFGSAGAAPDANAVTVADYAADVRAWVGAIGVRTGVPCVWLLGHSEGGLVALAAAADAPDVCGLVLVATAGRPVGAVLREQLGANPANAPLLDQAFAAIESLEAGRPVDTAGMNPALLPLFGPQIQGYLTSLLSYDPAALLADYGRPVLILHGRRDIQVSDADARFLAEAKPDARLAMLPDVNHVLKTVTTDDRATNVATYADPDLPLAPGLVETIADFIAGGG